MWHPKCNRSCELSGSTYGFNTQKFSMVGSYTENLEKQQNCQNWEWALAQVWALARDNTVFTIFSRFVCKWASTMILLFEVWIENVVNLVN